MKNMMNAQLFQGMIHFHASGAFGSRLKSEVSSFKTVSYLILVSTVSIFIAISIYVYFCDYSLAIILILI